MYKYYIYYYIIFFFVAWVLEVSPGQEVGKFLLTPPKLAASIISCR